MKKRREEIYREKDQKERRPHLDEFVFLYCPSFPSTTNNCAFRDSLLELNVRWRTL